MEDDLGKEDLEDLEGVHRVTAMVGTLGMLKVEEGERKGMATLKRI